ncbi:2-hydroxyacid dehydrogenase [Micromonospora marina]|uniref:2-hydroxyacid dehydrogenase n=1 Tax=Micromonospora marina TaxID=307120 RepID=UPI0034560FA0
MSGLRVWLPEGALVDELGPVPDEVTLSTLPLSGPLPSDVADVEVVVLAPPYRERFAGLVTELASLRLVQTLNAGIDWVPALPDGVLLCNGSGIHDGPVAEWVMAVVLAQQKRLPHYLTEQAEGRWDTSGNLAFGSGEPARDIDGSRVLVIGHGSIGARLERLLVAFGAHVEGVARHPRPGVHGPSETLRLLPDADVVVLLAPGTPESRHLVDAAFLAAMKPGALLVNAARGMLVDHAALLRAARERRVRAVLDSTDPEPLPDGHPLWSAPGVVITPHVAGSSAYWQQRAYALVGEQLRRLASGREPKNVRRHGY